MGRRKTRGRKKTAKEVDEDEVQLIQQPNNLSVAQELYPLPSSRYSTQSNNAKVREDNMRSHTQGDLAELIASQPSEKDCGLNKEASHNLTDLVYKLNENLSDAEEVDSATHMALVTVAGYKVKGEVASLLKGILNEHGDIASECILQTPESRAALLESVCLIYRELEPKISNITSLEVNKIQARIKDLETVRLRVEWLYKRLQQISTVKGLLEKSRSLDEARARCAESIEREERELEALEAELSNLQDKISSKKAGLALLKTEAETIESAFETVSRLETLPEQSVINLQVPVTRKAGGKKQGRPSSKVINPSDTQLHIFATDTHQQLRKNDHHQVDHDSMAYLKAQPCNSRPPHSLPQSIYRNLQHRLSESNLHAHSNGFSMPHHSAQFSSENECDQNYDAMSDDVHVMNTPGGDYTPKTNKGAQNQDSFLPESSNQRARGIRGITKPLRCWGTGQKMMLQLDEHNQVIGKLASPFASQLGILAKDGKKLPLIYTDWRTIPVNFKDRVWKEIKDNTNLHDDHERAILQKLSLVWRCWKGKVKKLYFTPYRNDNEKLAQHPPDTRIEKDQWPILVRFWKSKAALETSMWHQLGDEELEPEILGEAASKVLADAKMKLPEFRKKALALAVRAQMSDLRGHMAFAVSPNRTQVPESLSVQPTSHYFKYQQRNTES